MVEHSNLIPDNFNTPGFGVTLSDKKLQLEMLKSKVERLNELAGELDPYQPISQEIQEELKSLGILVLDDPFKLTNQLVVILEDATEQLHQLESELLA
ncbi:MAG: hypothetical protein CME71_03225 [Halobacteriovorax sp.]|nr:hypothetical protein [Halobacteriovorax sp.]